MENSIRYQDGIGVITLAGRLDSQAAPLFDVWFDATDSPECKGYLFDLSAMTYITSAGLRSILKVSKRVAGRSGTLAVCGMNHSVEDLFKISGFSSFLAQYATQEQAITALTTQDC